MHRLRKTMPVHIMVRIGTVEVYRTFLNASFTSRTNTP